MRNTFRKIAAIMMTAAMLMCWMPSEAFCAETEAAALGSYTAVEDIVSHMSTRQKITQCIMIDFRTWSDGTGKPYDMTSLDPEVAEILSEYQFGSVILFGENIKKTGDAVALVRDMQAAAIEGVDGINGTGDDGLPMIVATDQEGGIVYRLGSGTALPGNMALAATGDPANAETSGEIIAKELSAVGINTTLAPVIDVNSNAGNPVIGIRSFSDDADIVGEYGSRFIKGLDRYNTIGCAKHFPGHGNTDTDSHYGLPVVDRSLDELMQCELKPYQIAVSQGIDMIMTAHIMYPQIDKTTILSEKTGQEEARPATLSHTILTDILRGQLGFSGVVITDSMVMKGIADTFNADQATLEAFKAGADIVTMPISQGREGGTIPYNKETWTEDFEKILTTAETAVESDDELKASLDESVARVLKLKKEKGILDYDASQYTAEKAASVVGCSEHRAKERDMAAKAVTVVRNDNKVLPVRLNEKSRVLMLAPYNNERAQMVMGFNRAKDAGLVPDTARARFYRFSSDDYEVEGELKNAIDWADTVIICSELYNANDMSYNGWRSAGIRDCTEYCKTQGKKSVVMSINFPYDVQLYPDADAVAAVYGWDGSGIDLTSPDVVQKLLYGEITEDEDAYGPNIAAGVEVMLGVYGAAGKLPVSVPAFDPESKTYTDETVYPRGSGITYDKLDPVQPEPDDPVKPAKKVTKPKKAAIRSLKAGKRRLTVTMTTAPAKKGGTHYQIAYRIKGYSKWYYRTAKSSKVTLKKLKRGRKCVVKVRAYKVVNGKKYYGAWSKAKTSGKVK